MLGTVTILERLRRRRRPIARIVVLLVSWVWVSASASPCLGMMTDSPEQAHHGESHHEDGAPASHAHDPSPVEHAGHCPHCPPAPTTPDDERASSHISCSTADDLANENGRSGGPKWKVKYTSIAPTIVTSQPVATLHSDLPTDTGTGSARPPPSLNLRYCVFLN